MAFYYVIDVVVVVVVVVLEKQSGSERIPYHPTFKLIMLSLTTIIFLGKFLISQKLGVHTFCAHKLATFRFLDAVCMRLASAVMSTGILLL
jgi:hypothetical protein